MEESIELYGHGRWEQVKKLKNGQEDFQYVS